MRQLTVNGKISGWLADNSLAPICWRKIVFTLYLVLTAIDCGAASPYVDVVDLWVRLPVGSALGAVIFEAQVFAQIWVVDDLALGELAGSRGKSQGIGIGAGTTSLEATATIVSSRWA